MSIIFCESFENLGATQLAAFGKWFQIDTLAQGGGASTFVYTTGRFGGNALHLAITAGAGANHHALADADLHSTNSTLFFGFAFQDQNTYLANTDNRVMQMFDNNGSAQLEMRITGAHTPIITRAGTTIATSAVNTLNGTWYWVEIGMFISSTAGWVELRINGVLQASYYGTNGSRGTSNGNTQASGLNNVRFFRIGSGINNGNVGTLTGPDFFIDDIVVNDSNGTVNSDFIGDSRLVGLLPIGQGLHAGMTRTGGTVSGNYTAVNENPIDGDTSYVSSTVLGTVDTYVFTSLPSTASNILAVVAEPVARRDDAGVRAITSTIHTAGVDVNFPGSAFTLSSQYVTPEQVMETSPASGLAWLISDVNNIQAGPVITA